MNNDKLPVTWLCGLTKSRAGGLDVGRIITVINGNSEKSLKFIVEIYKGKWIFKIFQ